MMKGMDEFIFHSTPFIETCKKKVKKNWSSFPYPSAEWLPSQFSQLTSRVCQKTVVKMLFITACYEIKYEHNWYLLFLLSEVSEAVSTWKSEDHSQAVKYENSI